MLEKPDLADEKIAACLEANYGISATDIAFLQLGADSNSWVYRVAAKDGMVIFLKAKKGSPYLPSLVIPRYLRDQGIHQAVAPLPTRSQALWQPLEGFTLILYPFIEAEPAVESGMPEAQCRAWRAAQANPQHSPAFRSIRAAAQGKLPPRLEQCLCRPG